MNDTNTYETIINEKFREFSFPDMNNTWSEMKAILDRELPEKRKRGSLFWNNSYTVMICSVIAVSLISVGIYRYNNSSVNHQPISTATASGKVAKQTTDKVASPVPTNLTPVNSTKEKEIIYNQNQKAGILESTTVGNTNHSVVSEKTRSNRQSVQEKSSDYSKAGTKAQLTDPSNNSAIKNSGRNNRQPNELTKETQNVRFQESTLIVHPATSREASDAAHKAIVLVPVKQAAIPKPNWKLPDSLSLTQLISAAKDSLAIKTVKGSVKKKGWVVGASLNYNLPVSNQEMSTVSINGKKNALIDFLPSLYAQYHLNQKWYIESSFEFSSPQYTSIHKLASEKKYPNPNYCNETAIWLNKLYYLNLPFSVHFRPLPNLNIGTGIQYSYLRRSLFEDEAATWEKSSSGWAKTSSVKNIKVKTNTPAKTKSNNGRGTPTNPGSTTTPTKIDTVAQTLRSSDWRMLFDVNYSWKRINMGCRFNFGLNNYINTKSGNTILPVKDKNQAFQLYLRYDIFDKRKKIAIMR
jgi:hypothetical protein